MHFNYLRTTPLLKSFCLILALALLTIPLVGAQTSFQRSEFSQPLNVSDVSTFGKQPVSKQLIQKISAAEFSTRQSHLFSLNAAGELNGTIASTDDPVNHAKRELPESTVFLIRKGKVEYQAQTSELGDFSIPNVMEGVYSLVITGPSGFIAYGVYVSQDQTSASANRVQAAFVSPKIPGIKNFLIETLPANVAIEILHDRTVMFKTAVHTAVDAPTLTVPANQIRLINEQLTGQVFTLGANTKLVRGTMVNLVEKGRRIATAEVDARGNYSFDDVDPGVYDLVAVGFEGLAAIRFEAIGQDSPMTQAAYGRPAKLIATSLDICLTSDRDSQ